MKNNIATEHPDYKRFCKRWRIMEDALGDQDDIKSQGENYLPRTGGMAKDEVGGSDRYEKYKFRARFPELATQGLTAIVGLVFENEPTGVTDDIITNTGQANKEFARDAIRAVSAKGRDIFVVDAPVGKENGGGGGEPFITRYPAEALINWKVEENRPNELTLAVIRENAETVDAGEYGHDTEEVYRKYRKINNIVELSRWRLVNGNEEMIDELKVLAVDSIPVFAVGSIDLSPKCDPVPLLPVARCAISYYQLSADYRYSLHISGNPTSWVAGCSKEEYEAITKVGTGSGALWYLGDDATEAKAGFLETTGAGHGDHKTAMDDELKQAETYAVRLTQATNQAESGAALGRRAESQHASIYTIADSVSLAITKAQNIRAKWAGQAEPEPFVLDATHDDEYAAEQMITALDGAINSGNAPQSAMFEALRKAGLTELTDEAQLEEISKQGALLVDQPTPPFTNGV